MCDGIGEEEKNKETEEDVSKINNGGEDEYNKGKILTMKIMVEKMSIIISKTLITKIKKH